MKLDYNLGKTAVQLCDVVRTEPANMARAFHLLKDVGTIRRVRQGRVKVITVTPEGAFRGSVNEHGRAAGRYRLDVIEGGRADD